MSLDINYKGSKIGEITATGSKTLNTAGMWVEGDIELDYTSDLDGITERSSSDLTASGSTVNVPAGLYRQTASKNVATMTHPKPTLSLASGTGIVTASHQQAAGYVSAGTTSETLQLTTQAAQTITPGTTDQTIASGRYLTGTQIIKGDSDLLAYNIRKNVNLFNITGTFSPTLKISATQLGSGTPSPTNERLLYPMLSVVNPSDNSSVIQAFGGTLELLTGVLTVTDVAEVFSGNDKIWNEGTNYVSYAVSKLPYTPNTNVKCITNYLQANAKGAGSGTWRIYYNSSGTAIVVKADGTVDASRSAWYAYLSEHPLTVVYKLANPITYQLTVSDIATLTS